MHFLKKENEIIHIEEDEYIEHTEIEDNPYDGRDFKTFFAQKARSAKKSAHLPGSSFYISGGFHAECPEKVLMKSTCSTALFCRSR